MKLGKKVLSCFLAILMIMSCVSSTFSVFAADYSEALLVNTINSHYDFLEDAIDSEDDRRVPTAKDGIGAYAIEIDTFASSWYLVASAYAKLAQAMVSSDAEKYSYETINDKITSLVTSSGSKDKDITAAEYAEVLDYFSFDDCKFAVNLTVATGFDLLAWDTVEEIEVDRTYFTGKMSFSYAAETINAVSFVGEKTNDPFTGEEDIKSVQMIKEGLADIIESASTWKGINPDAISTDDLLDLITGEKSMAQIMNKFEMIVAITAYDAEEIWDHYIARAAGMTYAKFLEWQDGGIKDLINKAYALKIQGEFETLLAEDQAYLAYSASETRDYYLKLNQVFENAITLTKYTLDELKVNVGPHFTTYGTSYGTGVEFWNDMVKFTALVKKTTAMSYAKLYADGLNTLVNTEVPTYDHSDEAASQKWPGSLEEAKAAEFVKNAQILISNIENNVLPYCEGKTTAEKFKTVLTAVTDDGNYITDADYSKLKAKIASANLDVVGALYYEAKAKLDSYVDTWFVTGSRYSVLSEQLTKFSQQYEFVLDSLADGRLDNVTFETIFPNGMDSYKEFYNSIKVAILDRVDTQADLPLFYASEGDGKVTFYNFEGIIASYEAMEVTTITVLNNLKGVSVDELVETGVYEDEKAAQAAIDAIALKLSDAGTLYSSAGEFKTRLRQMVDSFSKSDSNRDKGILKGLFEDWGTSGWTSALGQISTEKIENFLTDMEIILASGTDFDDLMQVAVESLDKMILSEDAAKVVGALIPEGLGTWTNDYKDAVTGKVTPKGTEIKNLREYLINTIMTFLYSGSLQTTIMTFLYPALAGAVNTLDPIDIAIATVEPTAGLTDILGPVVPSNPHHWVNSKTVGGFELIWPEFFDKYNGADGDVNFINKYPEIYADLQAASQNMPEDDVIQDSTIFNHPANISSWDDVTSDEWDETYWNIYNEQTFYESLALTLSGVTALLGPLMQGNKVELGVGVKPLNLTIKAYIDMAGGLSMYDSLLLPLYRLLGLSLNDIPTKQDVIDACKEDSGAIHNDRVDLPTENGVQLYKTLFGPIFKWLYNDLFQSPVETILGLLPNLLAAIEYDQLLTKVNSIIVNINIKVKVAIEYNATTISLNVGELLGPTLAGLGFDLRSGLGTMLDGLFSATLTTAPPKMPHQLADGEADPKALTKTIKLVPKTDADGNYLDAGNNIVTDVADAELVNPVTNLPATDAELLPQLVSFDIDGTTYYLKGCGMLVSMMYGLVGDGLVEWLFKGQDIKNGVAADGSPISVPVNRILACGTAVKTNMSSTYAFKGAFDNYHIDADSGMVLLTVLRWLFDDGVISSILPLLGSLLDSSIVDMIARAVDGQGDVVASILISLVNKYNPGFTEYGDPLAEGKFTYDVKDEAGNKTDEKKQYLTDSDNDGVYDNAFQLGSILEETFGKQGIDKATQAVENTDQILLSMLPTIVNLFKDQIVGLGISEDIINSALTEDATIEDMLVNFVMNNDILGMLMDLLFATSEEVDADGNAVTKPSLIGGLYKTDIVAKIINILAELGFDITPAGYYKAAIDSGNAGYNAAIATWLKREAINANGEDYKTVNKTDTQVITLLETMTWANIGMTTVSDGTFEWFAEAEDHSDRMRNFIDLICAALAPISPIFSLLLTGEDITFLDKLTLRGGAGYSTAIVPLLDALGVTLDDNYISNAASGKTATQDQYNTYVFGKTNPNDKADRFCKEINSPLKPILFAVMDLLIGTDAKAGLLDGPITFLATALPNLAYFLYQYETDVDDKTTSNLTVFVENFIAPVLKLLDLVDPVLAKIIDLDIRELVNSFLDLETLINTLISQLLDSDWKDMTEEEQQNAADNYVSLDILDFGAIAAYSSSSANTNAHTSRHTEDGDQTFTYFTANIGQLIVTLMREIMSNDMVEMLGNFIVSMLNANGVTSAEDAQSAQNIIDITAGIVERMNSGDIGTDGAYGVDIITGILVDLLTSYDVSDPEPYFYQILNNVGPAFEEATVTEAWKDYGIKHEGYNWGSDEAEDADLSKENVETAIENIDEVINLAIPDVLTALTELGVFELPVELDFSNGSDTLWALAQYLLEGFVFEDDMVNKIVNLILGLGGTVGESQLILDIVSAVGFDINPSQFLYTSDKSNKVAYDFLTFGFDANSINAEEGTATIGGETVDFSWSQIYLNHTHETYEFNEDGTPVLNGDGTQKVAVDKDGNAIVKMYASQYEQAKDASGKYLYSYTDIDGIERVHASKYQQLTTLTVDGNAYALTETLSDTARWTWGIDSITADNVAADTDTFSAKKDQLVKTIWQMLDPFAGLFGMLFAGNDLSLFDGGLTLAGNNGYANFILPFLNALGLEQVLEFANNELGEDLYMGIDGILSVKDYYKMIYGDEKGPDGNGKFSADGMGKAVALFADYVFAFVELIAKYPITTLANALPTISYFLYADGITSLITNILLPITTMTDRLQEIVALNINGLGAGLIDMLATGSWETFQDSLRQYYEYDEDGNFNFVEFDDISLTNSLFKFITSLEFNLSSIVKNDNPDHDGMYSFVLFLDKEAELAAQAKLDAADAIDNEFQADEKAELLAEATQIRSDALFAFLKSIAALGDPIVDGDHVDFVDIDENGQINASKAEVLMFIIEFAFNNTTIKEILGGLLGYDVTDDNAAQEEVELLDEIITNVLNNPEALVGLIVSLLSGYDVENQEDIKLIEIEAEQHYVFYEDAGFSDEDVLEEDYDSTELSRVKTSLAIENLDKVIANILSMFKDTFVGEGGLIEGVVDPSEEDFTLKLVIDSLIEKYAGNDDAINTVATLLVNALSTNNVSPIVDTVVGVLESSGYHLDPQSFATREVDGTIEKTYLATFIGESKTWTEVAKNNTMFVYQSADGTKYYADNTDETIIDGVAVTKVTDENGKQATEVRVDAEWGFESLEVEAVRSHLVDILWDVVEPISPVLELFLTGKKLTLYEHISLTGMKGYKGVVLPLLEAFGADINEAYNTYEEYEEVVYPNGQEEPTKVLFTAITDTLFGFVDSLCLTPLSTLINTIPHLAHYLASDAVDTILVNILSPVTALTDKLSAIYDIDILKMVKDLLVGLIDSSNSSNGAPDVDSTDVEDQVGPMATLAAYALGEIENQEDAAKSNAASVSVDVAQTQDAADTQDGGVSSDMSFIDILWVVLEKLEVNGSPIGNIIPETFFIDLASAVWKPGSTSAKVEGVDGKYTITRTENTTDKNIVDKESVLINLINMLVFNDDTRNLIGGLLKMDLSLETLDKADSNYMVAALIRSVFESPEEVEKVIIELFSYYDIEYKPASAKTEEDYEGVAEFVEVDYDAIDIEKDLLEKLPSDIDSLIAAVVPVISTLLPEGTLGDLKLEGDNIYDILGNLVVGLLGDTADKTGYLTIGVEYMVQYLGGMDIVKQILPMVKELVGIDLELSSFKGSITGFAAYFNGCDTWADAYDKYAVTTTDADGNETTKVVLENTNSFGIKSLDDVLSLVTGILTPFEKLFGLLMLEQDLVILEGATISGGDGYDRFIIPLFEMFGLEGILSKDQQLANYNKHNGAFVQANGDMFTKFIRQFVNAPVETLLDAIPQLFFYIYSGQLAQGLEQFIAPVITIADKIIDIISKEFEANGETHQAIDVYGFVTDLINDNLITPVNNFLPDADKIDEVEDIYDVISTLLTSDGIEKLLGSWIEKAEADTGKTFNFGTLPIDGMFEYIVTKCGNITDVNTVREYGAIGGKVKGLDADISDALIGIISETILAGDMLPIILDFFGVKTDGTIDTILDAVTGDNRYAVLQILVIYFNNYDVETLVLNNLSFEKIEYAYDSYVEGTNLTQRKVRRSIMKLDQSILSAVPGLFEMLEENQTVAAILNKVGGYNGESLKDFVNELLEVYAFNDDAITSVVDMVIGLLAGDTVATILPLVDDLVGINLTPAAIAKGSGDLAAYVDAVAVAAGKTVEELTWTDVAADETTALDLGLDTMADFDDKKDVVMSLIGEVVTAIAPVVDFLLGGKNIELVANEDGDGAMTLYGNKGYENAVYELLKALSIDVFVAAQEGSLASTYTDAATAVENVIDGIFALVYQLLDSPIETLLTILPSLSYFISSNGIQVFIENLLAPAFALLDVVDPIAGPLVSELITPLIDNSIGDYLPDDLAGADGLYSISELTGIAGHDGSRIISILNNVLTGLLVKTPDGEVAEVVNVLDEDFFQSYVEHTITINKGSEELFYTLDDGSVVAAVDYDSDSMGVIVETRYVVEKYTVDPADSLVYLLDSVLNPELLGVLAELLGVDVTDESNILGGILGNLIEGDFNGLVITDAVVKLFEGYTIKYVDLTGKYVDTTKDFDLELDQLEALEKVPSDLDEIIANALPVVLPLVGEILSNSGTDIAILNDLIASVDDIENPTISDIVDSALKDMLFTNDIMSMLVNLIVPLLGMDIVDTIISAVGMTGIKLAPQDYLAAIEAEYTDVNDKALIAMQSLIGEYDSWADVAAAAAGTETYDFGITDKDSFVHALGVFTTPLVSVLALLFQGKSLSLLDYSADEYVPVDPDSSDYDNDDELDVDKKDESVSGNGYVIIRGANGYEQVIIPIIEMLGLYNGKEDNYSASNLDGIMSQAQFNELDSSEEILDYILGVIFSAVDSLADGPFNFLATNLAGVVYFLANDGVSKLLASILAPINSILAELDPIFAGDGFRIEIPAIELDNLLGMINGLTSGIGLEFTEEFLLDLAGSLGDLDVADTLRTTAVGAVFDQNGNYVDEDGNPLEKDEVKTEGKTIRLIGAPEYFLVGILDTVLNGGILAGATEGMDLDPIVETILSNLQDPAAMDNIVNLIIKLFNKYINTYTIVEEPVRALVKDVVDYVSLGITREDTNNAISTIDGLVGTVMGALGLGSLDSLLADNLYTDKMATMLVDLVLGLLVGIDNGTWNIINMVLDKTEEIIGLPIDFSVKAYQEGNGKLAELFAGATTWQDALDNLDGFDWGITSAATVEEKAENFVAVIGDFLAPIDSIINLLLAGGVYDSDNNGEYEVDEDGNLVNAPKSLSLFEKVNIMGGSGYNYVILPLFEALSINDAITQAEFNEKAEKGDAIEYILGTLLGFINNNLDQPITFVFSLLANLVYFISKDGLTTIVNNLVVPVSEYLVAIEDIVPISITIDLKALVNGGSVIAFYLCDQVEDNNANIGLNVDLNGKTLEELVDGLLDKFVPGVEIDLDFETLAAKFAATEDGKIKYTDSKVDKYWDYSTGKVGKNITGDPADTIITLLETIVTGDNINAILDMLGVDLGNLGLDESLSNIIEALIKNPEAIIGALIKVLNLDFDINTSSVVFKYLGELIYNYTGDSATSDDKMKLALNKLDAIIVNAIPQVLKMLGTGDAAVAIIAEIYAAVGDDATIQDIADYFLNEYAFKNDIIELIISTVVGLLGGLDQSLLDTIIPLVDEILGVDLNPTAFANAVGGKIGSFISKATATDETVGLTWKDVATYYTDENGKVVTNFDWNVTDKDSFLEIIYELITPFDEILAYILTGDELGYKLYDNALLPIAKALGLDVKESNQLNGGVDVVETVVDGIFGLIADISSKPITTIIETVSNLAFFIASDGIDTVINNVLSPVDGILDIVDSLLDSEDGESIDLDALLKDLIGISLEDIRAFAGVNGSSLIVNINELIGGLSVTDSNGKTIDLLDVIPTDFFVQLSKYAIDKDSLASNTIEGDVITDWEINAPRALMYVLQTVLSQDAIGLIAGLLKLDTNSEIGKIVLGLAGSQDQILDIIIKLVNEYDVTYNKLTQEELTKVEVNGSDAEAVLDTIDALINAILGMLGLGTIEDILDGVIAPLDLPGMIIELLVPVLAGLDIDNILDIVSELTNLDLDINPQAFTKEIAGSKLSKYIGSATTWQEVLDNHATKETDADGKVTYTFDGYDFGIKSVEDLVNFFVDLLGPLDVVFQVLLGGNQIIALEDKTIDRADIRINGGYGYNYAILPLLEAFGIKAISQADFDKLAEESGSSVKYILDEIVKLVKAVSAAPVEELLSRLANIFYFIGSDGINTVVSNLVAPINELMKEVDDVVPLAIHIDIAQIGVDGGEVLGLYLGKDHPGIPAGITVSLGGDYLTRVINDLISGLEINGTALNLSLDLDWNKIAAMMAKTDDEGNIITTESAQVYNLGEVEDQGIFDLVNIQGDPADTIQTIIEVVFTQQNTAGLAELIISILPDTLPAELKEAIETILNTPDSIQNLISAIIVVLTGQYNNEIFDMVYTFLGKNDIDDDDLLEGSIESLDKAVLNALPLVFELLGDSVEIVGQIGEVYEKAGGDIYKAIHLFLGDLAFNDGMMQTITTFIVEAIAGFMTDDIINPVKEIVGIDLAPMGYAAASGNAELIAYVEDCATWKDVVTKNTVDGELEAIFTGISDMDTFLDAIFAMIAPLDDILAFILCGKDLELGFEGVKLVGNDAYTNVIEILHTALGMDQLGIDYVVLGDDLSSEAALRNTIDYILGVVEALCASPISVILEVIGNLSYFIANNGVEVVIKNLAAPVLSILNVLDEYKAIQRPQIDAILTGFIGMGLTDIIEIAGNNGENLVTMINDLVGSYEIKDDEGNVVYTVDLLPTEFFAELSKAAIRVDAVVNVGDTVEKGTWRVDKSDELMYILQTVLSTDFLDLLCDMLGMDKDSTVGSIISSLANKEYAVEDILVTLLNEYTIKYATYNQADLKAIENSLTADEKATVDEVLGGIDGLIPTILSLVGLEADSLQGLVYPLFATDDIANMLVSTVVKLLAGLPSDTIDMVLGIVEEATNVSLDINPQAFAKGTYGSKLKDYIGTSTTWADVWAAHSANDEAVAYEFGITDVDGLVALVSDFLAPLDFVFDLLLSSDTLVALEEITIVGGYGYNYAIIPIFEALGITDAKTQDEFEALTGAGAGINYILTTLFDRVDEILDSPIDSVLSIAANLFYILGNNTVETVVANLVAPVNQLIALVDPIYPIAISIDVGAIGSTDPIVETFFGKAHAGVASGLTVNVDGSELVTMINDLIGGIEVNGAPLGITLNLDWFTLAASCAATDDAGNIIKNTSKLDITKGDYAGEDDYVNLEGSGANTLVAVLKMILTPENVEAILKLAGVEGSLGDPLDDIIDMVINDPEGLIQLIISILSGLKISYTPIQNREIEVEKFDYSTYLMLTEANADIIATGLDDVIATILEEAGFGSLKELLYGLFLNSDTVNTLISAVYGGLGNSTVTTVLDVIAGLAGEGEDALDLDFSALGYYNKLVSYASGDATMAQLINVFKAADVENGGTWADVAAAYTSIDWTLTDENGEDSLQAFVDIIVNVFSPFAPILELFLLGDGKELDVYGIKIPGCNGYDYGIIPILEAFGLTASQVMTAEEYAAAYAADKSVLLGSILENIVYFAEKLLDSPVDTLTKILPNIAYFISNEGIYNAVSNLLAPIFSALEAAAGIFGYDVAAILNISTFLKDIDLGIQILGSKYDFRIPEIDFLKLAEYGGASTKEVKTSRSNAANSYIIPTDPGIVRENTPNKDSQTFVVADQGDTITLVFTWLLETFADDHNRTALVDFLVDFFELKAGTEETLTYAINRLFVASNKYDVPDILVASLFESLGLAIKVNAVYRGEFKTLQEIYEMIFELIANGSSNPYGAIAEIMEKITGVWNDTVGDEEDYEDAKDSAEESLNWFQKILKAIGDFFRKLFGIKN